MAEKITMSEPVAGDIGVALEKKMEQEEELRHRVVVGDGGGGVLEEKKKQEHEDELSHCVIVADSGAVLEEQKQQEQEDEQSHRVVVGDGGGKKKKQEEAPQQNTNRPLRAAAAAPFKKRLMNEFFQFIGVVTVSMGFCFVIAAVYLWADRHFNDGRDRGSISVYRMAMELFLRASFSAIPLLFISAYFRLKFPEIR